MWLQRKDYVGRCTKFFRISLSHDTLGNYFQTNFALMQHHKYSLSDLEKMVPWEKTMYVTMLLRFIEEENEKTKQQINSRKK